MFASAQNKNINTRKLDIASRLLQGQPQAKEQYWSQLNLAWLGLAWIGLDWLGLGWFGLGWLGFGELDT